MPDIPDLWPAGVENVESIVTPLSILKRQAVALGDKTQGLVTAKVARTTDPDGDFRYTFSLVSPTANYSYVLFSAYHNPILLYPITCKFSSQNTKCDDQEAFIRWLATVLASEQTKRVVGGLMLQAREDSQPG